MTAHGHTRVIGIIGPPCSGKSTVAQFLQSFGGVWLNADTIAKEQLLEPEVIDQLVAEFGDQILNSGGTLSRERIADLVFGESEASQTRLKKLESVVHPRTREVIREALAKAVADQAAYVILDVPLLLESGWQDECDEVWSLHVSPDRHQRLLDARGWDLAELKRREKRQLSWDEKQRRSDWVIENDGSVEDLRSKVRDSLER